MIKHFCKGVAVLAVVACIVLAAGCNQNVTTPQSIKDSTPAGSVMDITLT